MSGHQWSYTARTVVRLLASVLIATMSLIGANAVAATYNLVDLGTLSQGFWAVVRGPNSAGVAVGGGRLVAQSGETLPRQGLVFQNGAAPRLIAPPAGSEDATVFGINDAGGVVGSANNATAVRAFISTLAGGARELPPLPGDTASTAFALNNVGQSVGFSSGASGERAVSWDTNGTPTPLPGPSGVSRSEAIGVNDRGDVAGVVSTGTGPRAVLWPGGQAARELAPLAGHATSEAFAINARGDVVGYSGTASSMRRATLWPFGGAALDLGTLPGGDFSQAFGSNDAGEVVGSSGSSAGDHAFIWTRSSGLQDLNTLIAPSQFVLTKAVGINNLGMIVAIGFDASTAPPSDGQEIESHELPMRVFLLVRQGDRP
jgi:probable HAF family extracellular repeat protein